jgi:hypothetical protein
MERDKQHHDVFLLKRKLSEISQEISDISQETIMLKQKLDEKTKDFKEHQKQLDLLLRSNALDVTINHHDFVPINKKKKLWVTLSMAGVLHFPYDADYNPNGKLIIETIEQVPCLRNKKTISVEKVQWLGLNRATNKCRFQNWRECLNCTPKWMFTNWEFARSFGMKDGWYRWQNRSSTDQLYHADACDLLKVDDNDELVRVDEEVVLKSDGSSQWKPCLLCHKRLLCTEQKQLLELEINGGN